MGHHVKSFSSKSQLGERSLGGMGACSPRKVLNFHVSILVDSESHLQAYIFEAELTSSLFH